MVAYALPRTRRPVVLSLRPTPEPCPRGWTVALPGLSVRPRGQESRVAARSVVIDCRRMSTAGQEAFVLVLGSRTVQSSDPFCPPNMLSNGAGRCWVTPKFPGRRSRTSPPRTRPEVSVGSLPEARPADLGYPLSKHSPRAEGCSDGSLCMESVAGRKAWISQLVTHVFSYPRQVANSWTAFSGAARVLLHEEFLVSRPGRICGAPKTDSPNSNRLQAGPASGFYGRYPFPPVPLRGARPVRAPRAVGGSANRR